MRKAKIFLILILSILTSVSCSYFKKTEKTRIKPGNICTYTAKGEFIGCESIK